MPHLATRSGDGLAIEVKPNVTAREDRGIIRRVEQVLPEEVGHHRGATLARLESLGFDPAVGTPAQFNDQVRREEPMFARVVRDSGIKAN